MRQFIIAGLLAVIVVPAAAPAVAQERPDRGYGDDRRRDDRDGQRERYDKRGDDRRGDDRRGPDDRRGGEGRRGRYDRPGDAARDQGRGGNYRGFDYNHPDPRYGNYRADRYYRGGDNYKSRRLGANDRIYRGSDNRYYCRRQDGTTGLIIGGLGGGVLGNVIAPGGSKTLGTILGGAGGALLGRSVDRNNTSCR